MSVADKIIFNSVIAFDLIITDNKTVLQIVNTQKNNFTAAIFLGSKAVERFASLFKLMDNRAYKISGSKSGRPRLSF